MTPKPIPKDELPHLIEVFGNLVREYGHPGEVPIEALLEQGIEPSIARAATVLGRTEDISSDPGAALATWRLLLERCSA